MEVILDKLYPSEFFGNGGVVKTNDGKLITDEREMLEDEEGKYDIKEAYIGTKKYMYDYLSYNFKYINPGNDKKDPYGIPNSNFTLIEPSDKRWDEFKEQRIERGFDDSETWSLDYTIARFIYPRLNAFYNDGKLCSYPGNLDNEEEWGKILEKMLYSFKCIIEDKTDEDTERFNEGMDLFREYYLDLWN